MPFFRRFALVLGALGCACFGSAFVASIVNPDFIERTARNLIRYEVEKKVHEKIESLDSQFLAGKAAALATDYEAEIAQAKRQLAERLPARLAEVIAEMQNFDCECRKKIETTISAGFDWRIAVAAAAQERLTTLIRSRYMEIAKQVIREFRIFTGTNALVFAFLFFAVLI